ncbi:nicotinate-nucleotide adenylyltransferase [Azonexus sp.]|uniref:nicotinate-nucleotide adenylyltransferase n=1 Tax=Azonexus sp. TaxID=1872668 RepID=UPI0039E388B3
MSEARRAIGLYGGTFNPVHHAHLRLAEEACDSLGLQEVRWIPAGWPPHRPPPEVSGAQRLAMVRLAIADNPRFSLDSAEVDASTRSYTVHTLQRLRAHFGPQQPLVLLLGADAAAALTTWHQWPELFALAHLAIAERPGYALDPAQLPSALAAEFAQRAAPAEAVHKAPAGYVVHFPLTALAISATGIRQALAAGQSVRYLLPQKLVDYIRAHSLYTSL